MATDIHPWDGVCDTHHNRFLQKVEGKWYCVGCLLLQNDGLRKALKEIMQLVQTPRPVGWTAEGTIYKVAEEALADKRNHECPCKKCGRWCIQHCADDSPHCVC